MIMRVQSVKLQSLDNLTSYKGLRVSRSLVFSALEKITHGRLVISEGEENYCFGQEASDAFVTARIKILSDKSYNAVLSKGMVGAAEAYIQRQWKTDDLVNVIRLLAKNIRVAESMNRSSSPVGKLFLGAHRLLHANTLTGSKKNISAHYDLGNDFFELFLDKTMMYSSAIFSDLSVGLETAAEHKLDTICKKLDLNEVDHVVEIGTGWGGFACYAAKHYGCKVTTTTISQEQFDKAQQRVEELGLEHQVNVLFKDYRELEGQFDKLVSIEMIEAVGHEFYDQYFNQCSSLLKPDGLMLLQSILISDQRYNTAKKETDFIKRYIFPGGCLPSVEQVSKNISQNTDMQMIDMQDITYDYAKTLELWRERFYLALPEIKEQGFSEEFIRMWVFYLCYCQAGFMERVIHTSQFVFAKPGWRDPRYPE